MEAGLNIFWSVLAIAGFCYWHWRGSHAGPTARSTVSMRRSLTLACALAVLFPVISLTDDLHGEQVATEDGSRTLNKKTKAETCLNPLELSHSPAQVPQSPFTFSNCRPFAGTLVADDILYYVSCGHLAFKGRAPPVP